MALRYRLKHALRAISSGAAAPAARSPIEAARSSQHAYAVRASESANANLKAWNWPSEASFKSSLPGCARWSSASCCANQQQQYHSTSLLQKGGRQPGAAAAESSTDKWDIGNPPVDESATERGSSDRGRDAAGGGDIDRGVASRSSHTLRKGNTPEAQVDVAYTPNLDRPTHTGEVVRTNLRRSEDRRRRQERDIPHPLRADDPDAADDSRTREGTSPDAAAAAGTKSSSSSSSSSANNSNNNNMHMVASDEDKQLLWCMGVKVAVLCPGARTAGAYSTLEYTVAPGEGSSTHTHEREDETWYMLDGTLRWQLEDRTVDAHRGSFIHLPRGLPHSFANVSDEPARMLVSSVPAGFEDYFLEIGVPVDLEDATTKPVASKEELERATEAGKRYGISYEAASGKRGGQTTTASS